MDVPRRHRLAELGSESGQAMVEYAAVALLIAVIIVGVASVTHLGATVVHGMSHRVDCIFAGSSCTQGSPNPPGGPNGSRPTQIPAADTTTTEVAAGTQDLADQTPACGAEGTPVIGPVAPGRTRGCVTTSDNEPCVPVLQSGGEVSICDPITPTANDPWIIADDGSGSCPPGYDLHLYDHEPYCANGALDPNPGTLDGDPYDNNREDLDATLNGWLLHCGSAGARSGCEYNTDSAWDQGLKYDQCYNEGGEDCDPPEYLPEYGLKDPSDPSQGYQMFPYGKPQEEAYEETFKELYDNAIDGLREHYESQEQQEETLRRVEEEAYAQVGSSSWVQANVPDGDGELDSNPADGDGEDEDF